MTIWPDEPFRYQAPTPGVPAHVRVPQIETFTIADDVTVYLVARDTLPTISLGLAIPNGTIADPPGRRGLVGVTLDLVEQGTARLDKAAWSAKKADIAASINTYASAETMGVGLACLHRNFEDAAALMFEMIETPGMRSRDLERVKSHRKNNLAQNKAAPASLARRLWPAVIHGSDHPYGRPSTSDQYDAIDVVQCETLWSRIGPQRAGLFVAGATNEAEIRRVIEPGLSAWARRIREPIVAPTIATPVPMTGTIFVADIPGAAQSQLILGHHGPPRTASDYEATRLMAQVLGGGFSSRINMNIREDKGYAYGARAGFSYRKHTGTFSASSSVRTDATADALRQIAIEIRRIREAPVDPAELARERDGTLLALPASFATAQRIRSTYADLVFFGLPLHWYEGFQRRIAALTIADLHAAAAAHLREGAMKVLVVGDASAIRDDLHALASTALFGAEGFVELDPDACVRAS